MQDLRTSKRFPVCLPIRVVAPLEGVGSTDNISAAGCYLRVDVDLPANATLGFVITIPSAYIGQAADVTVRCEGRVMRCEKLEQGGYGVACVLESYEFVRG